MRVISEHILKPLVLEHLDARWPAVDPSTRTCCVGDGVCVLSEDGTETAPLERGKDVCTSADYRFILPVRHL